MVRSVEKMWSKISGPKRPKFEDAVIHTSMAVASGPMDRLQQLENIEKEISAAILSAGKALEELAKEKPQMKAVETHTTGFIKTLESVEAGLMTQINYLTQVSTGQPHEGSCYAAQKDLLMAYHRKAHVQSRLEELEKIHTESRPKHLQLTKSYSLPPMAQPPSGTGS